MGLLKEKMKTNTKAVFWKIKHDSGKEDICLKIGRYTKNQSGSLEITESENPKSELTLDDEEFHALIKFIESNYEPLKQGVSKYIPIENWNDVEQIQQLRGIFADTDQKKVLNFIKENNILSEDLLSALENQSRIKAITEFVEMLGSDLVERDWQSWFEKNPWIFGSDFIRILDERNIDTQHITDYLLQAYDGFLDIIEIKRPSGSLNFWANSQDHGNYYPSSDLTKAISQANSYIYEVEREANSVKFLDRIGGVKTVKPRCVLIFGRSIDWNEEQKEAYRILNAGYHNLSILTYDHVLDRAKRILGISQEINTSEAEREMTLENVPF